MTDDSHASHSTDSKAAAFVRLRDTRVAAATVGVHARRVGVLRWALPLLVLGVIGVLIAWPMLRSVSVGKDPAAPDVPNLMIENLHFTGLDASGRPYSVTADRAFQVAQSGGGVVDLEKPSAETTLASGAWVSGRAAFGRYDEGRKRLWLTNDVQIFHDGGYQFTSNEAEVDMTTNTAWGSQAVLIQGPFGEIRGKGFRLLDGGKRFLVQGPAVAVLNLKALGGKKQAAQANPAQLHPPGPSGMKKNPSP